METHNGISNGVNGTAHEPAVETATIMEVKSIESLTTQSSEPVVQASAIVEPEIAEPLIAPQVEAVATTLPVEEEPVIQNQVIAEETASISVAAPQVEEIAVIQSQVVLEEPVTPQVEAVTILPVEEAAQPSVQPDVVEPVAVAVEPAVVPIQPAAVPVQLAVEPEPVAVQPTVVEAPLAPTVNGNASSPQVIPEPETTPAATPAADKSSVTLPGSQPGTSDFNVPQYAIFALNRIAKEENFTDYVIHYDRGSNFGDGFVAEIVRATIKGKKLIKGVEDDAELVLIIKLPPESQARRQNMGMNVFEREVLVYNEILPMFEKFQLDKGLRPGQGFVSFPKCYYASHDREKDEAIIVMEDIRKKGFKMLSKYKTVDYPHAQAVLETMAQLHGLSLAMKDQCPELFNKFKGLKDAMSEEMVGDMLKQMTQASCQRASDALEPHEEVLKEKVRAFGENIVDILKTCTNGELSEPYSVINHGDCWVNNIMFKYEVI